MSDINQCKHEFLHSGVDDKICVKCNILKDEFEKQHQLEKFWLYEFACQLAVIHRRNFDSPANSQEFAELVVSDAKALIERLKKEEV